ncbi:putative hemolysin-iii family protein [Diaporthe ampelina]|uniref:Putative hemolysin-iii family protein n=1 Tax=Diaporthe ampelina TaxID=1214573 RepID=A0A0G2FW52_9PEZI|nr:putative hemolysin-iii family protein [Diaporthe ampelina]
MDAPSLTMTSCTPFAARASDSTPEIVQSTGADTRPEIRRRRHSHFIPRRRKSIVSSIMEGEEAVILKVDLFLSELERRLEFLESYTDLTVDSTLARAYNTLQIVRSRCNQVSEEVIGEGRRRFHVMMETMEYRYHDALAAADSMSDKARVSIELLDSMLSDVEMRAHKLRQRGLQNMTDAAEIVIGEGRHVLDKGLGKARGVVEEGLRGAKHAAESLEDKIQKAMLRAKEHGLISYEDLPVPWRVNPHIVGGYRFTETYSGCIRSAFGVSNELVNIWSHAIGLVLVLALAFYFYPTSINFHLSTNADVLIAALFFFAACQCLVCSTIWHTMNAITDVNLISTFACVDYTGISLLIAASIMTTEYTAFYWIGGVILPWNPTFNRADMAWVRVAFFVFLGATGFLPILQLSVSRGTEFVIEFYSPIGKSILVYVAGAFVYASKQKDMKSATAAIAVPIQISVQRSLLAAEVVVAVGDTATSTSFGTAPAGAFAASVCAPTSIVGAGAVASDFDIWNRIVNGPLDSGRDSIATEPTDAVEFCCSRVSE